MQVKRRLQMKHTLHMSAKDEAIKKTSEKTAADPKKAHKWIKKEELAAKKEKAKVKKLAEHKKAAHKPSSSHETKSQKLIKWYVFSAVSSCPRAPASWAGWMPVWCFPECWCGALAVSTYAAVSTYGALPVSTELDKQSLKPARPASSCLCARSLRIIRMVEECVCWRTESVTSDGRKRDD